MRTAASSMERSFQIKKEVTSIGEQAELCRTVLCQDLMRVSSLLANDKDGSDRKLTRRRRRELTTRIRESSMASCSGPRRKPCSPSPLIPSTWAPRLAFSPCSILGALTCFIIPTYTGCPRRCGLSPDRTQWVSCQAGFFLSVRVLSKLFRRLFLELFAQSL
jgi:hypothetical protein